jgi:hypothetical protein
VCQEVENAMMRCLIILYLSLYFSEIIEDEVVGGYITYGRYEKPVKYFSRRTQGRILIGGNVINMLGNWQRCLKGVTKHKGLKAPSSAVLNYTDKKSLHSSINVASINKMCPRLSTSCIFPLP